MWRTLTSARFLLWLMVGGGLFLRGWHYLAGHTIWWDEAVLLMNVMEKDFGQLVGPLRNDQAAPPLFLWLLKAIHLTVGDEPYVWRLVPLAFDVGGLLLTVPLARRLFPPHLAAFAVGLVAVSDNHVWLGCNVKPYAGDAFAATALLWYLTATPHWPAARRLLVLAAATPVLLGLSYPAAFGVSAVLLALLPAAYREVRGSPSYRRYLGLAAWVVAGAVAAGTLAVLYFGPIRAQRSPTLVQFWQSDFLDYDQPWAVPWHLLTQTIGVGAHACLPSGVLLVLLAPLGGWALWRDGRKEVVLACAGLFAAALAALAVRAYPYGEHRLCLYLAPAVLVLGVAGVGEIARRWKRVGVGLAVVMFVAADGVSLSRLVAPWDRPASATVARYVRAHRRPGEPVLSDETCYLYFFFGELKPMAAAPEVPAGGRVWVVMDFFFTHGADEIREHNRAKMAAFGFEPRERVEFHKAEAWVWERTGPGGP